MNKIIKITVFVLSCLLSISGFTGAKEVELSILYSNDMEGELKPCG